MQFGTLQFHPALDHLELVAAPVASFLRSSEQDPESVLVSAIDASLADTAAFCEHYEIGMDQGANCVIVESRRGSDTAHAACLVLGAHRADVNGVVRRHLEAKKVSFASMDTAVGLSGMEYGGITPVGLPPEWPILVDEAVAAADWLIIGSGIRGSKLLVRGSYLASLPNARVMALVKPSV